MLKIIQCLSRVTGIFAILTAALLSAACRPENGPLPPDKTGSTAAPQRIISLGPAVTEAIYLLGAQDRLVGCTIYCERPAEAKQKAKIGSVTSVNVELIIGLKPDLILATPLTDPRDLAKLTSLGANIIRLGAEKDFPGICSQFIQIGQLTGKEAEAGSIVEKAKQRVDAVSAGTRNLSTPRVFVQAGSKPLFTAGRDSFINDFILRSGGTNVAASAEGPADYGLYSYEKVVSQDPEVILILAMGITGEAEKQTWSRFTTVSAVKNSRIYALDSYDYCSPTPEVFAQALERLSAILHPDTGARP
jgi:ABC-type Fe3+-hydroxamate transport system substrate-binding protein